MLSSVAISSYRAMANRFAEESINGDKLKLITRIIVISFTFAILLFGLRCFNYSHNTEDLISKTDSVHYAAFRSQKLHVNNRPQSYLACDDAYDTQIETAKQSFSENTQKKEEEMRQRFIVKVREKEQELREREEALNATRAKMMDELETLRKALENEENILKGTDGRSSKAAW